MTHDTIGSRDFDYIEARLLVPCMGASEAYQRLIDIGQKDLAEQVMKAMQNLVDEMRTVRRTLTDRYYG